MMKYIIFQRGPFEVPVTFHELLTHNEVTIANAQPIAAGFISDAGQCFGHSVSLKLASRPQDTEIVRRMRE